MPIGGKQYCIYVDEVYIMRAWVQTVYARWLSNEAQRAYNKIMRYVRIAVNWSYGEVKKHFTCPDFPQNCKTCMRHSIIVTNTF